MTAVESAMKEQGVAVASLNLVRTRAKKTANKEAIKKVKTNIEVSNEETPTTTDSGFSFQFDKQKDPNSESSERALMH